jgi:RNA polymerase sigma-70 factor (ECF subfamily)
LSDRETFRTRAAGLPAGAGEDAEVVRDLVRRTQAGDDDAFAELFRRYRDKVFRISFRFTRDRDEALDLVQAVFIKVHRSLSSYREESSFATWISRVATNVGIDHVRSRKREAQVELDESALASVSPDADAAMATPSQGPAAAALNRELGQAIGRALDDLSEKHRTVFTLHCVEGMPYQAIADTLQISIGTVMSRLFHARRYLRKSLAPYLGEARVRSLLKSQDEEDGRSRRGEARGAEGVT